MNQRMAWVKKQYDEQPRFTESNRKSSNSAGSYSRFDDRVNSQPTRVGRRRRAGSGSRNPKPNREAQNGDTVLNFDSYESVPVEVSGSDVPEPVDRFEDIGLVDSVRENIRRCRYVKPTPIQKHAIPIALSGRDLMACAQTGSGKTAAFCLPMIDGVLHSNPENGNRVGRRSPCALPVGLVIAPTRELSCQIYEEATKFSDKTGVRVGVVYGGAPFVQQVRSLAKGADILVATPGRLVDMIKRGKVSLRMIKYLTLDEADRMLDMGFEPQIREIVEQMDMPPTNARQTMLFSATFPDDIQRLASDFLTNYIFLSVGRVGSSTDLIAQKVEYVENMDKRSRLMDILRTQMKNRHSKKQILTLVFVETKRGADALEDWLSKNGLPAIAIHGDKIQIEREKALKYFKTGAIPTLVATDVASRGLDIPHVAHVVNFDLPKVIDNYVHRIGRTGRAGKSGLATAFFNEQNIPLAKALVDLMQETKQEVPDWLLQYVEQSSNLSSGVSHRYKSSKFGGRDIRRGSKYDSFAASSGDYYAPTNAEDYCSAYANPEGYGSAYANAEDYGSGYANTYDPASYGGDAAANGNSYVEKQESGVADDWDWN